jgi:hypothetical protein
VRIGKPAIWLGVVSAILVVAFVWTDRDRITPGPISSAHGTVASLARSGCESCHGERGDTMAQACASCHREVVDQLAAGKGFHGTLDVDASACGTCHVEHHGDEIPLVGTRAFALAGVPERNAYDHHGLAFGLTGRHASLACRDCHPNADAEVLPEGERRFLGLTQTCAGCHEDVHGGKLQDCASCHGQEHPFERAADFVHTAEFRLEAAHAGLACATCHEKGGPHAIEEKPSVHRACIDCHASPHGDQFLTQVAVSLEKAAGAACESCHATAHGGFGGSASKLTAAQHAATGFPLAPPHDRARCEACHANDAPDFAAAHPGRDLEDCRACHADPHAGEFDRGPFAGTGCLECHERHEFRPPTFDLSRHARTGFALTGSHAAVPCASCHAGSVSLPPAASTAPARSVRSFTGASTECASCHADAHEGFFARAGRVDDAARRAGCAACHDTSTFSTTTVEFAHGRATGFELEGAHATAECASCHEPAEHPDARGRTFGRATSPTDGESCRTCHADPHGGVFDGDGKPREIGGRDDCGRCHTVDAFHPTRAPFDHALWTGFRLVGSHETLSCEQCHAPTTSAAKGRFSPVRGTECAACHADPHVGQFADAERAGATDCGRCHATSGSFRRVAFDHQRDSRFHPDEAHRNLACSACHQPFPVADGVTAIRYKPLGTACGDCHDPRGGRSR